MPVTFKTQGLIDAAQEALDGHVKADAVYQKLLDQYRADKAAERDMLPRMRALRDELSRLIKAGKQPTRADAQRFKRLAQEDYLSSFYVGELSDSTIRQNVNRPAGWLIEQQVASYQGLIKMLQAHTEETISANQLKLFGYTNLELLFRLAALSSPVTDS